MNFSSNVFLLFLALTFSSCSVISDANSAIISENGSSDLDFIVDKVKQNSNDDDDDTLPGEAVNLENYEEENHSDDLMIQDCIFHVDVETSDKVRKVREVELNETTLSTLITQDSVSNTTTGQPETTKAETQKYIDTESTPTETSPVSSVSSDPEISVEGEKDETIIETPAILPTTTTPPEVITIDELNNSTFTETTEQEVLVVTENSTNISATGNETISVENALKRVDNLSNQIRKVLTHYRNVGEVVLPGESLLPDPLAMPDTQNSFSLASMTFTDMQVYGLSNFTVEHVNTDLDKMQVYVLLHMKRLVVLGNYTMRTFFKKATGPFNVTLLDVDSEGAAELKVDSDGQYQATDSEMDMYAHDMKLDFKNLGFMGSMFQGMVSGIGTFLFDSIKPQIIEEVNSVIRNDVNTKLKNVTSKLVSNIPPVDLAVAEGRKYVKENGYDPYRIKDYTRREGEFVVNITHFVLNGLSKFYRVGNLSLSMDSGVIQIGLHVATAELKGDCHWSVVLSKYYSRTGYTNFSTDHLQVRAIVNQSLDVSKHPVLEDLDIEIGRVKLKMDGTKPLDVVLEYVVNSLPTLIRHIIVDAMEEPIKNKVQDILNDIDVEKLVEERLPKLDDMGL